MPSDADTDGEDMAAGSGGEDEPMSDGELEQQIESLKSTVGAVEIFFDWDVIFTMRRSQRVRSTTTPTHG